MDLYTSILQYNQHPDQNIGIFRSSVHTFLIYISDIETRYYPISYLIPQHTIFKVDVCICADIFASNYFRVSPLCTCHNLFNIAQWRTSRLPPAPSTTNNATMNIFTYFLLWMQMIFFNGIGSQESDYQVMVCTHSYPNSKLIERLPEWLHQSAQQIFFF